MAGQNIKKPKFRDKLVKNSEQWEFVEKLSEFANSFSANSKNLSCFCEGCKHAKKDIAQA